MLVQDTDTGFTVEVTFDEDGFPLVRIDTGGGYYSANFRPAIEVRLNDVLIHEMFDDEDERWNS